MIWLRIPGMIVGKGRPRVTYHGTYTDAKTKNYENYVKWLYRREYQEPPTDEAVKVVILVTEVPAKSLTKKKRAEVTSHPPMKKPDIDNIAKIILDALNGIAWIDDKQVYALEISKIWGAEESVLVGIKKESEE